MCFIFFFATASQSKAALGTPVSQLAAGTVVEVNDVSFVKLGAKGDNGPFLAAELVTPPSVTVNNTGNSVTLPYSAGNNLSNYQVYGNTVQESPVPSGYTQIEYLQSSGTQYIDTGFIPNQDTKVEVKFASTNASADYAFIYGSRGANTSTETYMFGQRNGVWRVDYDSSALQYFGTVNTDTHTVIQNKNLTYLDNTLSITSNYTTFSTNFNMYLFSFNDHGNAGDRFSGKLYYTKIWDNGTLVRNFIPAIRDSDSVAGMYDTVTQTFYTNAGTGTFTTGAAVTTPTPDVPYPLWSAGYNNLSTEEWRQGDWNTTTTPSRVSTNQRVYVPKGETVTISFDYTKDLRWVGALLPTVSSTSYYGSTGWQSAEYTFTTTRDTYLVIIWSKLSDPASALTPIDVTGCDFQIEWGSTVHPFVPYGQTGLTVGTAGRNILDLSKFNSSITTSTGITLSNLWAGTVMTVENVNSLLKPNTTYTTTAKVKVINKPTTFNPSTLASYILRLYYSGGSSMQLLGSPNKNTTWENGQTYEVTSTFTTPADLTNYSILAYNYYGDNDGSTNYSVMGTFEITNLQIEEGSTATSYQPYTADTQRVVLPARNLFNPSQSVSTYNCLYSNGTVTQIDADTRTTLQWIIRFYLNGVNTWNVVSGNYNGLGRFSLTFTKNSTFNQLRLGLNGSQKDTWILFDASDLIDGETYTISWNITNATQGSISWNGIQIEEGSTATPYVPYGVPEPLRCAGNVCDYIDYENQQVVRNIGKYIFTGTEYFQGGLWGDNLYKWFTDVYPQQLANTDNAISSHYIIGHGQTGDNVFYFGGSCNFASYLTTAAAFKAYLAAQYAAGTPVTVEYQLATPYTEPLSLPVLTTPNQLAYFNSYTGSVSASQVSATYDENIPFNFDSTSATANTFCNSDLQLYLNNTTNGYLSTFNSTEQNYFVLQGQDQCYSKLALIDQETWEDSKSIYETALANGGYGPVNTTSLWTQTPVSAGTTQVYAAATASGSLIEASVDSFVPLATAYTYLDSSVCTTTTGSGSITSPYGLTMLEGECLPNPILPTLQWQTDIDGLYWNAIALEPSTNTSKTVDIAGYFPPTPSGEYTYQVDIYFPGLDKTYTATATTNTSSNSDFTISIPITDFDASSSNISFAGPQTVTVTDTVNNFVITGSYNVSFYFPIYQQSRRLNIGNYITATDMRVNQLQPATFQNFTAENCQQLSMCTTETVDCDNNNSTVTLIDERDGKQYQVRRFADGKCWMIDNLRYGGDGNDGCAGKSTFDGGYTSSTAGYSVGPGAWTNGTVTSTNSNLYGSCRDASATGNGTVSAPCLNSTVCGYYYSWQAVMQTADSYYGGATSPTPGNDGAGICPTGWHPPTSGSATAEFGALDKAMGGTGNNRSGDTTVLQNLSFYTTGGKFNSFYSGYCNYSGGLLLQGSGGYFWSQTGGSSLYAPNLYYGSSGIYPSSGGNKCYGFAVRCVRDSE